MATGPPKDGYNSDDEWRWNDAEQTTAEQGDDVINNDGWYMSVEDCKKQMKDVRLNMFRLEQSVAVLLRRKLQPQTGYSESKSVEEKLNENDPETAGEASLQLSLSEIKLLKRTQVRLLEDVARSKESEASVQRKLIASEREVERLQTQLAVFISKFAEKTKYVLSTTQFSTSTEQLNSEKNDAQQIPQHLEALERNAAKLQSKLTAAAAEDISGLLFNTAVFTLEEHTSVTKCSRTQANAAQTLINLLLKKRAPAEYYCFLDALKQKNLTDAYTLLTLPGVTFDEEHIETIRQRYLFLLDNVDAKNSPLLGELYTLGVITLREMEDLGVEESSIRRTEQLLYILSKKSRNHYELFLSALSNTGQRHVVAALRGQMNDSFTNSRQRECDPDYERTKLVCSLHREVDENVRTINALKEELNVMRQKLEEYNYLNAALEAESVCVGFNSGLPHDESLEKTKQVSDQILMDDPALATASANDGDAVQRDDTALTTVSSTVSHEIHPNKERTGSVCALTVNGSELFVVRFFEKGRIEVYNATTFAFRRYIKVNWELRHATVWGLASCDVHACLYISDFREHGGFIHRVELTGANKTRKWKVDGAPHGLSVNNKRNLLVACGGLPGKLVEYATKGVLIREILLHGLHDDEVIDFNDPWHAIQLDESRFLISSCYSNTVHQVCLIDAYGRVLLSYGNSRGSSTEQLCEPRDLAVDRENGLVFVADSANNKIVVLDCVSLKWSCELDVPVFCPHSLYFDDKRQMLFIGEGSRERSRIVIVTARKLPLVFIRAIGAAV